MTKEQKLELVIDLLADCNRINAQYPFQYEYDETHSMVVVRGHCRQIPRLLFFLEDVLHFHCYLVNDERLWVM